MMVIVASNYITGIKRMECAVEHKDTGGLILVRSISGKNESKALLRYHNLVKKNSAALHLEKLNIAVRYKCASQDGK